MMDILSNPRHARVVAFYTMACAFSRAHDDLAATALQEYGNHGPRISGCVRGHFPERIKETLRYLAQQVTIHCDMAEAAKPARLHNATLRKISQLIAARDGSGFYGPQPSRSH